MSYNGHLVVDMDSHFREYEDVDRTYGDYIEPTYRDAYERLSEAVARRREAGETTALFMDPRAIIEPTNEGRALGLQDTFGVHRERAVRTKAEGRITAKREPVRRDVHWDPSIRLADMDKANIDVSLIFPSHAASYCTLRDVGLESALHQAHHRYMSNYCSEAEGRLRWAAIATMRDVPRTVEEMTYWAEGDDNMAGILLSPACPDGRLLDNPALHPIYERAQDLEIPILVHGGVLRPPYTAGAYELDDSSFLLRAFYQPWSGMTAIGAIIGGGVFDLFPRLKAGVFETSAGWMPWVMEQLDDGFESRPDSVPNLRRRPSDILAEGQLFHAVEAGEKYVEHCVDELGEDVWMFATDYPHTGSPWPNGVQKITDRPGLSESAKVKILGANAQRLCPKIK